MTFSQAVVLASLVFLGGCERSEERTRASVSSSAPVTTSGIAMPTSTTTTTGAATSTTSVPAPTTTRTLKPPDADSPAAGICPLVTGTIATVEMHPDVPSPRCVQATPDQRLHVRNEFGREAVVRLASFETRLDNGEGHTFDRPFGHFLAPGVHSIQMSVYSGGYGAELWLREGP